MSDLRIYVACLASYNAGTLYGRWIDIDGLDADDIGEEVAAMLAESPIPGAEEWTIYDHEGFPCPVGEWESFETLARIASIMDEYGEAGEAAIKYHGSGYLDEAEELVAERYIGAADHGKYPEELYPPDFDTWPDLARWHFDMEDYVAGLENGGAVTSIELGSQVHWFWVS